jgi:hypothetical protein
MAVTAGGAWAGTSSGVLAQGTRPDSGRVPSVVPLPVDTGRADSLASDTLLRDTTHHRVSKADSILLSYHPDTTKTKPPLLHAEQPRLLSVGPSYHWDRDQLFASGALTLADLLSRIPGFEAFAAGWISTPMVGTYMGNPGRIRVFYDGLEIDPLDPGMRGMQDFAAIELWTLNEVSVEIGADELRVYIRSWNVTNTTPTTRADVLTGNEGTNLFRAFFGDRLKNGADMQVAAQQFNNIGPYGGGGAGTSLVGRAGWSNKLWAFDAFADEYRRGMDPLARLELNGGVAVDPGLPDFEKTYSNAFVRGGYGDPDHGVWAQLIAGAESFKNTSPLESSTIITSTVTPQDTISTATLTSVDSVNSESQYVAAGGFSEWGIRFSGTERVRVFPDRGAWSSPSARASFETGPLAVEVFAERNEPTAWPTLDSLNRQRLIPISTEEATARLTPLPFLSLLGDVARTTSTGAPDAPPTSLTMRGEAGIRIGQMWFSGGVVTRDTALVQGMAIYDTTYVPAALGRMTGYYGTIRGTLLNLITADVEGIDWGSEASYRPHYQARGELSLETSLLKKFPRHDFHIKASGVMEYSTAVPFPTTSGTPQLSTGAVVLSSLLEIRILQGTITWQLRNLLGYPYNLVPGYIMPRAVNIYGIRWDFWN